ncbi:unnamed protein product [Brachionus calyciflorus]|uniref:Uncharacterized protein n=1 Tax=Brachionus calyciflorus TaxID=104777 RepID=A0A813M5V7_9BILA|nr:unnamed protein product [Brachionus calyciflorus]
MTKYYMILISLILFYLINLSYSNSDDDFDEDYADSKIKSSYVLLVSGCVLIVAATMVAFLMFSLKRVQAMTDLIEPVPKNKKKEVNQKMISDDEDEIVHYDAENSGLIRTIKTPSFYEATNQVEIKDETTNKSTVNKKNCKPLENVIP